MLISDSLVTAHHVYYVLAYMGHYVVAYVLIKKLTYIHFLRTFLQLMSGLNAGFSPAQTNAQ